MFESKFLNVHNAVSSTRHSRLVTRRAAMRSESLEVMPVPEQPSISPMTSAFIAVAENRTGCPEVPSVLSLATADVEPTTEKPEQVALAPATKLKKREKKPKSEVRNGAPRKRTGRKTGGTRSRKTEPSAFEVESENPAGIPQNEVLVTIPAAPADYR